MTTHMNLKWKYECPKCCTLLNPAGPVTLVARVNETSFMMAFHPEPGNYDIYLPPQADYTPGLVWDFFCPVCRNPLTSEQHETLCEVIQIIAGARFRLLFSRVAGEKATYVIGEKAVAKALGDDADRYDDTVRIKLSKEQQEILNS